MNKDVMLLPGIVIETRKDVKHWHWAQKDAWFQHLATEVSTGAEASNEWLEPVSEEHYSQLYE